ncbi:MAG TPA: CehA/McbA family metallohydrolase [Longimicrobiaceae bacterium]
MLTLSHLRPFVPGALLLLSLGTILRLLIPTNALAQARPISAGPHLLSIGGVREWSEPAGVTSEPELNLRFEAPSPNGAAHTLALRQTGVRRTWVVELNGSEIGRLYPDENPHRVFFSVPEGALRTGENRLRVAPLDTLPDDVALAAIELLATPREALLGASAVAVTVLGEDLEPLPGRITIVDGEGALVELATESGGRLAVRPGVVYTGDGRAEVRLPAGSYRLYATRGFEYGVDSVDIALDAGETEEVTLRLRREVPTEGWVATDTHLHTYTHSGHGDATLEERAITIAGEALELPILTDHNVHVDLEPVAVAVGVRDYFTPVIGDELTTPVGHFNLFPVPAAAEPATPKVQNWAEVKSAIAAVEGVGAVVLNHARDIHLGFRPFDDGKTVRLPAERTASDGGEGGEEAWPLPAHAMEVLNSGSQQTDPLELFRDWLELLGRAYRLTPVGSSDSHDVARYIPGQGRTYIRVDDRDPARIDVDAAVERFRAGAVTVSFGLFTDVTVNDDYGPGDTVPAGGDSLDVGVRVLGPAWTRADRVSLYVGRERVRTEVLADSGAAGVKWSGRWRIPRPAPGSTIVALAEGPDPHRPFWPIALPYQPRSPAVAPKILGISGAVWIE